MAMGHCHRYFIPHCGHGTTFYGHGTLPSLFHPTLWAWNNTLWPWDTAIAVSLHTMVMPTDCHRYFITHYGHGTVPLLLLLFHWEFRYCRGTLPLLPWLFHWKFHYLSSPRKLLFSLWRFPTSFFFCVPWPC